MHSNSVALKLTYLDHVLEHRLGRLAELTLLARAEHVGVDLRVALHLLTGRRHVSPRLVGAEYVVIPAALQKHRMGWSG